MCKQGICITLLLLTLTASPALAGSVTLNNFDKKHAYTIVVSTWVWGIEFKASECVEKDKNTTYNDIFGSIGRISVHYASDNNCNSGKHKMMSLKEYAVSGSYMPGRKFSVTINNSGSIRINEN